LAEEKETNMRVTVKLFATLVRFKDGLRAGKPFEVELPEGALVQDLIDHLKIPMEETHVVFINNVIEERHSLLNDGDVVGMFPPVGGG
jgi:molybdopterin converting factor small subunit